jgi:hypothetical protein
VFFNPFQSSEFAKAGAAGSAPGNTEGSTTNSETDGAWASEGAEEKEEEAVWPTELARANPGWLVFSIDLPYSLRQVDR